MELLSDERVGCSSVVEHLLKVLWIGGSIPHGGPFNYVLLYTELHKWCNRVCCIYSPVCDVVINVSAYIY